MQIDYKSFRRLIYKQVGITLERCGKVLGDCLRDYMARSFGIVKKCSLFFCLEVVCEFHLGRGVISDECKCSHRMESYCCCCLQGKWDCEIYTCHAFHLILRCLNAFTL